MRLVHVSEEPDIELFVPRIPYREDMDKTKGLVWALTDIQLTKFLTPRDCPRIAFRSDDATAKEDVEKFFSSSSTHCIAIEHDWYARMASTTLFVYEFDTTHFYFNDTAGFYVSDQIEKPVSVTQYSDLFGELFRRDVEVRIVNNLWSLAKKVKESSLHLSMCRMGNAKSAPVEGF